MYVWFFFTDENVTKLLRIARLQGFLTPFKIKVFSPFFPPNVATTLRIVAAVLFHTE